MNLININFVSEGCILYIITNLKSFYFFLYFRLYLVFLPFILFFFPIFLFFHFLSSLFTEVVFLEVPNHSPSRKYATLWTPALDLVKNLRFWKYVLSLTHSYLKIRYNNNFVFNIYLIVIYINYVLCHLLLWQKVKQGDVKLFL